MLGTKEKEAVVDLLRLDIAGGRGGAGGSVGRELVALLSLLAVGRAVLDSLVVDVCGSERSEESAGVARRDVPKRVRGAPDRKRGMAHPDGWAKRREGGARTLSGLLWGRSRIGEQCFKIGNVASTGPLTWSPLTEALASSSSRPPAFCLSVALSATKE